MGIALLFPLSRGKWEINVGVKIYLLFKAVHGNEIIQI